MALLLLAAHLALDHDMLDMATHYASKYDVATHLQIDDVGNATFHVAGNVTSRGVELAPGAGAHTVMASHTTAIDHTWSGHATVSGGGTIVIHFDRGPSMTGIDIEWRCSASSMTVAGVATSVWKCGTSQSMTRPSGAAYPLEGYLQVPIYFADASVALRVDQTARGGADHRSTETSVRLTR
jgi:hypothetical protein